MTPPDNLLARLARINPTTAFVAALVLLLAGFFLPGIVGAALLVLLAAALTALTYTTWPVQSPSTRAVRIVLLVLLLAVIFAKVL
jgi:Family of unknown function (DUF6703)